MAHLGASRRWEEVRPHRGQSQAIGDPRHQSREAIYGSLPGIPTRTYVMIDVMAGFEAPLPLGHVTRVFALSFPSFLI